MFKQLDAKSQILETMRSSDPSFICTITLKPSHKVLYLLSGRGQIG